MPCCEVPTLSSLLAVSTYLDVHKYETGDDTPSAWLSCARDMQRCALHVA